MTVTTDKDKTYEIEWMWGPVGPEAALMLQLRDARPLSEIAAEFEGCGRFRRASDTEGDLDFEGYTALTGITRPQANQPSVRLTLTRPEGGERDGD